MSLPIIAPEAAHAERWRQWQLRYAASSRKSATWARIVFTVILTTLVAWLGLQFVSSQLWA